MLVMQYLGLNDVMVSMLHEMSRFVTHNNIKDEVLDNPYEKFD
jgi:hypothetical protein